MENRSSAPVMSLGDWIITFIVLLIPLVNIIMVFVWGFSKTTNPNKANFCKAYLILMLISVVLFFVLGGMAFMSGMSGMPDSGM
jgi:hypothetical protein